MKIIYNKYFPFGTFWAINLFGVIFCRMDKGRLPESMINHEYIHSLQQREMLYVGFLIWYVVEFIVRLIKERNWMKAYYGISFEQEAYTFERDLRYREHRKRFGWWRFITSK